MKQRMRSGCKAGAIGLLLVILGLPSVARAADAPPLPLIQAHGSELVDVSGHRVILKGCNLGNWFIIELWMLGGCIESPDQAHLLAKLDQRFGPEKTQQLMDIYRQSWITPRDFDQIKSFGFNVVRLPIDYRLLQSDEAPYAMKEAGFKWIDHAVDMAESAGIYIILDLHSAPGGQSNDQCTGQAGQNKLWNNAVNQQREVDIWRELSNRYRNRSNVAGYDIMNEPYADHHMDVKPELKTIMANCYTAIRENGDKHVMFFPGALGSPPTFYGDPRKQGWTNVGFTEHFYPGLFGDKVAFESHIRTLTKTIPARQKWLDNNPAPYYIGEFNPVLDSTGGTRVTRAYYDTFAQHGWAGTLWNYKLIKPEGGASSNTWYCVSNAASLPKLSLESSSYEELSQFFSSLATVELAINQPLFKSVTDPDPTPLPILASAIPQGISPADVQTNNTAPPGWTTVDIGRDHVGAVSLDAADAITVIARGMDVFGKSDSFRFVSKPAGANIDFVARVNSLLESDLYAKAGVMARFGDDPGAACVMINTFPDGGVAFLTRAHDGEVAKEIKTAAGSFPVDLRLRVNDGKITGLYRRPAGQWTEFGNIDLPAAGSFRIGLAVDSHTEESLTKAAIQLIDANTAPAESHVIETPSLLSNGSFETDLTGTWTVKGQNLQRESDWKPVHSGKSLLVYHHQEVGSGAPSEVSQEVAVQPGKRYHFIIFALRDDPRGGHDAGKIELRLVSTLDGHSVTLNSTSVKGSDIGIGDQWTPITVDGTAIGNTMRVAIILTPSTAPRGGAIKLDDASLELLGK